MEYLKLKEISEIGTGSSNTNEAIDDGIYPFYIRSKEVKRINKYEYDEKAIVIPGEGAIGDIFHYVEGKYSLHQRAYRIAVKDENIYPKYIYYYLKNSFKTWILSKAVSGTVVSIRKPMIEEFKVPIPSIDIQKNIVEKLDKFTEYISLLNEELILRQKQFRYYLDKLLSFDSEVNWVEIGDLLEYIQPNKYIVKDVNYNDNYDIPVLTAGQTFILGYTNEKDNIYKASKEKPSIIFDDFTGSFHWVDFNFKVKSSAIKMLVPKKNKNVNFRYIYHFMKKLNYSSDKHLRLWISVYSKFKIPILSIEKQREIVSILDKFEALCSDTLPNEIALREKQYEYYRDRLLNFKG